MFLSKYGNSLPRAFDTNLYSSPLYIYKNNSYQEFTTRQQNDNFPRVNYNKRFFTLIPKTKMDIMEELTWATLKIQSIKLTNPFLTHIQKSKNLSILFKYIILTNIEIIQKLKIISQKIIQIKLKILLSDIIYNINHKK